MWDPGFHFAEVRLADVERRASAEGYQRRHLKINLGRGSQDYPALMLSLEPREGCCRGLAFRIAADFVHAETAILWRREMLRGGYAPAMVPMTTPQGPIEALAFVSNPSHPSYVGELPLAETARLIASGKGILGTNREYLVQLAMQLEALGIEDPYVAQLHAGIGARRAGDFGQSGGDDTRRFQTMFERPFSRCRPGILTQVHDANYWV